MNSSSVPVELRLLSPRWLPFGSSPTTLNLLELRLRSPDTELVYSIILLLFSILGQQKSLSLEPSLSTRTIITGMNTSISFVDTIFISRVVGELMFLFSGHAVITQTVFSVVYGTTGFTPMSSE